MMLLLVEGCCWTSFRFTTTTGKTATCTAKDNRTSTGEHRKVVDTVDSKFLVKAVAVGG